MQSGILATIGNTPTIRLERVSRKLPFRLYAKLEGFNPGGSIKDRTALSILERAFEKGEANSATTIIESSSGNMGIGLAQACMYMGVRFICVVDPKTTSQNIKILKTYGAEIDLVSEPDPETGEFLQARLNRVRTLCQSIPNSFWPDQYANLYNPIAHHRTMAEIILDLGGVDYLFCATSTCGTIRGCVEFIREQGLQTKIFAVDAVGSRIFGAQAAKRLIPGHGASVRPKLFQESMAERCIHVTDLDCVVGCRRLVRQEAILVGGSSGAVLMAVEQAKQFIEEDATCVMIFPDRGERYLDTIYSDEWVKTHFGEVSHLWQDILEEQTCVTTN